MKKIVVALLAGVLALSACTTSGPSKTTDGREIFWIKEKDSSAIRQRHLDAVNTVRNAQGLRPVSLNGALTTSAGVHARDIAAQKRAWHFGSDGSSPLDRARRAGFPGVFVGENVSETYEDDFSTLKAWLAEPITRAVVMNPNASQMGISWFQQKNGKIWWVQNFGR